MRCAMRATENPSLCCAVAAANALRLPLLVLITVEERHEHATARRTAFILQGAADVLAGLRSRGIPAALHVERAGRRAPVQLTLAHRAAVVVGPLYKC
jgi:deoxyribodipyrimidine photolyase